MWLKLLPWLGAAAVVVGTLFGVYRTGYNAALREAQVETLQTRISILERDNSIAKAARDRAIIDAAELEAELAANERELDAIRNRPESDRSPATQSDIDLLYGVQ